MNSAQLKLTETKNVQVVPVDPHVKFAKTCKLFNAGVSGNSKIGKTVDPSCYDSPVSRKTDPAVDAAGLFENQIRRVKMERAIALKKLTKMFGRKLGWRIDPKAATPEQRAAAKAKMAEAVASREALKAKKEERYRAILAADGEYQRLSADYKEARDRADNLFSIQHHKKLTVGTNEGLFFLVKAEGDSWEEIFEVLEKKRAA